MSSSYATFVHLVAGGAAGTFGAIVTCPLEVLKTRLQSSKAKSTLLCSTHCEQTLGTPDHLRPETHNFRKHNHNPFQNLKPQIDSISQHYNVQKIVQNKHEPARNSTITTSQNFSSQNSTSNKNQASSYNDLREKFCKDKLHGNVLKGSSGCKRAWTNLPIVDSFKTIVRNEGWQALFKGLGPNLVGVAPSRAIYFCTYSNVKSFLNRSFQGSSESPIIHMTSAASAGFVSCTATNPIWFVKTRLQLSNDSMTVMQCMKSIYKTSGALGFYKGITASYMGISETIIHFVIYEFIKSQIQRSRQIKSSLTQLNGETNRQKNAREEMTVTILKNAQSDNNNNSVSGPSTNSDAAANSVDKVGNSNNDDSNQLDYYIFLQYMFASAFSKTIASSLTYPHEVARTRLREEGNRYNRFWQTIILVWREEGLVGLYRGLSIQLLRSIPFTAITMSTYELLVTLMSVA